VVMRGTGNRTIILSMEDGPRTPDSQLYLYIGRKDRSSDNALRRSGLDNGKLYVFAADDPQKANENQLLRGDTVHGNWKAIVNADQLTDVQTEAAADALGAFGSVRIEDGEFKPHAKREFWFDTTGDQTNRSEADPTTNELGRLYRLRFDKRDPLNGALLTQAYNADQLTAAQDGPLSPDNLTVTKRFVMINEDGTGGGPPGGTGSRDDMEARNRDGSIWQVPLATAGDPASLHARGRARRPRGGGPRRHRDRRGDMGDQRDRGHTARVRQEHLRVRRAGAFADDRSRRDAGHSRGRAAAASAALTGALATPPPRPAPARGPASR
jgi:Bacterial protein of unknown function (DUF839)